MVFQPIPVWLASPPEVHSALLSAGPGAGPLLAAAAAWSSSSAEYAAAAEELSAIVNATSAGLWEGAGATRYLGAHVAYVSWLRQAGADSAAVAVQHQIAAAAYGAALAAMPTLAELNLNHATHAVLAATNFFGVNTIPIALNEADYVRMWVQAATTMTTYQAVSAASVAATPAAAPSPQIIRPSAATDSGHPQPPSGPEPSVPVPDDPLARLLQSLIPGDIYEANGAKSFWELIFPQGDLNPGLAPPGTTVASLIQKMLADAQVGYSYLPFYQSVAQNPQQFFAVTTLLFTQLITHRLADIIQLSQLLATNPMFLTALAPTIASPGFAGLSGLSGPAGPAGPTAAAALPVPAAPAPLSAGFGPAAVTAPVLSSAAPLTPPPPSPAPPPPAVTPPPAPVIGVAGFGYLLGGGGPGTDAGSGARATAPNPASATAAAPAAATAVGRQTPARRRRRDRCTSPARGHRYEFLDSPETAASDHGAGTLGFAGTAHSAGAAAAAGLTTLTEDLFGSGPVRPMLPGSWQP